MDVSGASSGGLNRAGLNRGMHRRANAEAQPAARTARKSEDALMTHCAAYAAAAQPCHVPPGGGAVPFPPRPGQRCPGVDGPGNGDVVPARLIAQVVSSIFAHTGRTPLVLTAADNGRRVPVAAGQPIVLLLPSHPSMGRIWRPAYLDPRLGRPNDVSFLCAAGRPMPGAPGWDAIRWNRCPTKGIASGDELHVDLIRPNTLSPMPELEQRRFHVTLVAVETGIPSRHNSP